MEPAFKPRIVHHLTAEMGSPKLSTDALDLTTLPERLDDVTLARLEAISTSPLPALLPCDDQHFSQCLRIMQAVLPKRNTDDLGGELFVAAYHHQLAKHPAEAISFLLDKATSSCKWFPTIAECLEIMGDWRRHDSHLHRQNDASRLARAERNFRSQEKSKLIYEERWQKELLRRHESISKLPEAERNDKIQRGIFRIGDTGLFELVDI